MYLQIDMTLVDLHALDLTTYEAMRLRTHQIFKFVSLEIILLPLLQTLFRTVQFMGLRVTIMRVCFSFLHDSSRQRQQQTHHFTGWDEDCGIMEAEKTCDSRTCTDEVSPTPYAVSKLGTQAVDACCVLGGGFTNGVKLVVGKLSPIRCKVEQDGRCVL